MEANVEELMESFKFGYEELETSRIEAQQVWDLYHNRHYTREQLSILANRGQPAETFNVIKMFARMLVGYYSTIVNTIRVLPTHPRDAVTANVLNDVIKHVFSDNRFDIEGDQIKLGGMISGLLCSYTNVEPTGEYDRFGRSINKIVVHHIPDAELVLDPNSMLDDYSDAEFLHRFRWLSRSRCIKLFGKDSVEKMDENSNYTGEIGVELDNNTNQSFVGTFKVAEMYLIIHSVVEDSAGKRWSCFWHNETMIQKDEITYKEARWPYRVQKLHSSDQREYYGIFREVAESQHAINQAVIKIQLLVNSDKVFVQEDAVSNLEEFRTAYNRVSDVIPVTSINGIKIEKLNTEVQDQYIIVDRALDRIQRVLGINDSFLGMAYASDSGRKVKLQQSATIMSLRYVTARIESFYRSLGTDITALVKQYYRAEQVLLITDDVNGQRWVAINQPIAKPTGQVDQVTGQPVMEPILLPEIDPASEEYMEDEEGNIILAPIAEEETDFTFTKYQVTIESTAYNDEDEKAQLLLETMMSGQIGQMVAQINPAGFFKMASLSVKSTKTRFSPDIAEVLEQTSQALQQDPQANTEAANRASGAPAAQGGMSQALKLPANTNEGVA